jgi:hypothetical protein
MDRMVRRIAGFFTGRFNGLFTQAPPFIGLRLLAAAGLATTLTFHTCINPFAPPEPPASDPVPELASTPYGTADDVWISARYSPEHQGIDFSARKEIAVKAPGSGVFYKNLYFHPGVPRWQVNAEIRVGKYAIDCLFEPGDSVTEAQARTQFDMLVSDGTEVNAGDLLGRLTVAPGQEHSMFHLGVRLSTTGQAECPMPYCTPEVRAALLALYRRDQPGGQICTDHTY